MTIGENIKRVRKEKGLTQKQLAEILGVTQQMIGSYENSDREPKLNSLSKIAKALDVDVWELIEFNSIDIDENVTSVNDNNKKTLDSYYNELNEKGQEKAVEQVELLTKIPEYKRDK